MSTFWGEGGGGGGSSAPLSFRYSNNKNDINNEISVLKKILIKWQLTNLRHTLF